jgi:hypothetical protein
LSPTGATTPLGTPANPFAGAAGLPLLNPQAIVVQGGGAAAPRMERMEQELIGLRQDMVSLIPQLAALSARDQALLAPRRRS